MKKSKARWLVVLFLGGVFYLATPCSIFRSVEEPQTRDDVLVGVQEGGTQRRLGLFALGGFGILSLLRLPRGSLRINGLLGWVLIVFVLWSLASVAWAEDVDLTVRRLGILVMMILGAAGLGGRFSLKEVLAVAFAVSLGFFMIGLAAELLLGSFQPWERSYRFAGLMNPNESGRHLIMMAIAALALRAFCRKGCPMLVAVAWFSLGFAFLTKSRGSVWLGLVAVGLCWWLLSSKRRKIVLGFLGLMAVPLVYFIAGDLLRSSGKEILLLGRDEPETVATLTNRVPIWRECLRYVDKRPLLGYGYNGFWTPKHSVAVGRFAEGTPIHSHNQVLETMLGTGLVGAACYVGMLILSVARSLSRFFVRGAPEDAFATAVLVSLLLFSVIEAPFINASLYTFVTMAVIISLGIRRDLRISPLPTKWETLDHGNADSDWLSGPAKDSLPEYVKSGRN